MQTAFTTNKLIVLYMLQNSSVALSNSAMCDYILEQEWSDYFRLQQSISELVDSGLIVQQVRSGKTFYQITEEGRITLSYLEQDLQMDLRRRIQTFLKQNDAAAEQEVTCTADYYAEGKGYTVRCRIIRQKSILLELTMAAPSPEAAKEICRNWPERGVPVYEKIMEELL